MSDAVKALVKAQMEMGKVLKNAQNPHLKNKYADLGSVMDACLPALHANGFAVIQPAGCDERGPYVDTVLLHESGGEFRSRIHLVVAKNDMQGIGSAQTYSRRYGLLAMAGLAPEDDDGHATRADSRREEPKAKPQEPNVGPPPAFDAPGAKVWLLKQIGRAETAEALDKLQAHETYRAKLTALSEADAALAKEVVAEAARKRFTLGADEATPLASLRNGASRATA